MEFNSSVQWIVIYLGTFTNFYSRRYSVGEGGKQLVVFDD